MKRLLPLLLFFAASCSSDWWLGPHLMRLLSEPRIQASSITPITSLSSGAPTQLGGAVAGALYAQADRIDVLCTASGAVTLYLIEWSISGSRWSTQGATGCALDSASGPANATCRFVAKRQPTYWHVYKTGAGSVSNCLIEAVYAGAGLVLEAQASSGSGSSSSGTGLEDIREITLWLDASVAAQNNTSASLAFLDQSGKGHRFTGSSGITYLTTGGPNSLPAWSFDGSSYMEGISLNNYVLPGGSPAVSVFAVVYLASFTGTPELIQIGTDHATSLNSFQFAFWTDGGMYAAAYGGEGNERYTAASTVSATTWTLVEWVVTPGAFSGSNPVFKKNGVAVSSTRGTGADTPNIQPANVRVGGNLQGTAAQLLPSGSKLAELIVMNSVNSDKIALVEAYLMAKYAL